MIGINWDEESEGGIFWGMQEVCFGHNFETPVKHSSGDFK